MSAVSFQLRQYRPPDPTKGPMRVMALSCMGRLSLSFNVVCLCRELLNAHRDNLGTMVKLVIFNELSNARNPNNMQVLHTVLQHSPEQAPKVRTGRGALWGSPRVTCGVTLFLDNAQTELAQQLGELAHSWHFLLDGISQPLPGSA